MDICEYLTHDLWLTHSQAFDKVTVLYEGRQIYFGRTGSAKAYFEGLGFDCKQTEWPHRVNLCWLSGGPYSEGPY